MNTQTPKSGESSMRKNDIKFQAVRSILFYKRIWLLFVFFSVIFTAALSAAAGAEKITIFFYSSETNINNFKSLKMEFDKYLSGFGLYEFQPFNDRDTFEAHIRGKKDCFLMLSSWHYRNIYREYGLHPLLVGVRNGKKDHKRVLVAKGAAATLETVKKGAIASASSVPHTRNTLKEMFHSQPDADTAKILTVPKDIDALMSVGFGMSRSALTSENSLDSLKGINPVLYKEMKTLAQGAPSLLLVLAMPEGFADDSAKLLSAVKNMSENPNGKDKIKMLDLDGWNEVDAYDRSKLEGVNE